MNYSLEKITTGEACDALLAFAQQETGPGTQAIKVCFVVIQNKRTELGVGA